MELLNGGWINLLVLLWKALSRNCLPAMLKLQLLLISSSAQGPSSPSLSCSLGPLPLAAGFAYTNTSYPLSRQAVTHHCLWHFAAYPRAPGWSGSAMDDPSTCCRLRPEVKVGCWTCSASESSVRKRTLSGL